MYRHWIYCRWAGAAAIFLAGAHVASAESLSDRLNAANKREATTVEVACGKLDKANCAQLLPRIAQRTADAGITLMPLESEGSVESTAGVCQGLVPLAIGQRDAIDLRYRKPDCVGKLSVVGKPLYPYWGFLVVRADNPKNGLTGMIDGVNKGQALRIAAGKEGSGGRVTLGYILRANPTWGRIVSMEDYGEETALDRIKSGEIDGFFVMDAPNSDLIQKIKTAVDEKGKQLFKFQDVRPGDEFYKTKDYNRKYMYQEATIAAGFLRDTRTVWVDAQTITSNRIREDRAKQGPAVISAVDRAIDLAQPSIWADTETPRDWTPASARR